jgi:hypothetical protein
MKHRSATVALSRFVGTLGNKIEQVAGNGVFHRLAPLERGAAFDADIGPNGIFYFEMMSLAAALSPQSKQEISRGA